MAAGRAARLSSVPLALVRPVPRVPLLALNMQLSVWGALLAGLQVLGQHAHAGADSRGPLHGFGGYAWGVVALQALGGLVVSVVILYTDNIIKGCVAQRCQRRCCSPFRTSHARSCSFAMAVSILLSWLLSIPLFGLQPSPAFVVGLALVVASVVLFSSGSAPLGEAPAGPARRREGVSERGAAASARCAALLCGATFVLCVLTAALTEGAAGRATMWCWLRC